MAARGRNYFGFCRFCGPIFHEGRGAVLGGLWIGDALYWAREQMPGPRALVFDYGDIATNHREIHCAASKAASKDRREQHRDHPDGINFAPFFSKSCKRRDVPAVTTTRRRYENRTCIHFAPSIIMRPPPGCEATGAGWAESSLAAHRATTRLARTVRTTRFHASEARRCGPALLRHQTHEAVHRNQSRAMIRPTRAPGRREICPDVLMLPAATQCTGQVRNGALERARPSWRPAL